MTQGEKAKAYDEALKVAKSNYETIVQMDNNCTFAKEGIINTFYHMFPELKEGKGERIRKEIISFFKQFDNEELRGVDISDWIAWLEKQKAIDVLDEEEREFANNVDSYRKEVDSAYQKGYNEGVKATLEKQCDKNEAINMDKLVQGVLRGAAINLITWIDYNAAEGNMCLSNMECKDIEDALVSSDWDKIYAYMKKKLEKQDEQTNKADRLMKALQFANEKIGELVEENYYLKEQGEQKADNVEEPNFFDDFRKTDFEVEPKFKVGDMVKDPYGDVYHIIEIDDSSYKIDDGRFILFKNEEAYKPWTIQDAKKGDILQANKCTLIFDSLTKDDSGNTVISSWYFCDTEKFYGMGTSNPDLWDVEGITPATKEQCDLLFKKMKEAGYEWDVKKKELKKVLQNTTDKVKSKFKVGDWVFIEEVKEHKNGPFQINSVDAFGYSFDDYYTIPFMYEDIISKWSIQDAKDGDVLATKNFIFIFKNIDNGNGVHYYCQYEISKHEDDNQFDIALPQSLMGRVGNSISHYSPATKEQCDLLFQKMKEAGYEWDTGKKELSKRIIDEDKSEIDYCFTKMMNGEKVSPAWSEEDEKNLLYICKWIKDYPRFVGFKKEMYKAADNYVYWLKSLKERMKGK